METLPEYILEAQQPSEGLPVDLGSWNWSLYVNSYYIGSGLGDNAQGQKFGKGEMYFQILIFLQRKYFLLSAI